MVLYRSRRFVVRRRRRYTRTGKKRYNRLTRTRVNKMRKYKKLKYRKRKTNVYNRKWNSKIYRFVKNLDQMRKSTWLSSENLRTTIGNQNMTWWLGGYGGSLPTSDPGTSGVVDLAKIWFEETGTSIGNRTRKIFIDKMFMDYDIVNNAEAACDLTIYNVMYRKDQPLAPSQLWETGMVDTASKFIEAGANITPVVTTIGVTPFHSSLLCQNIKILKTKNVRIYGGQFYKHKVVFNVKKSIDGEWFRNTLIHRGNYTFGVILVLKGQIINDLNSPNEIQYAVASINTTMRKTITYKVDQQENKDQIYYYNNLSNKTAVTAPLFIQPESGIIDTTMATT